MVAIAAMLAGCSAALGIDDLHPPTIHGTLRDATDFVSNAPIALYRAPDGAGLDGTPIDHATTDGAGKFAFPVSEGLPLHGYLDLADPRFVRTISHLIQPVVDHADVDVEILTLTAAALRMLASDAHMNQDPARSIVVAQVIDADGGSVEVATLHAEAGEPPTNVPLICFADRATSLPCATDSMHSNGVAWLFDVPETSLLKITAVDAEGKSHEVDLHIVPGPSLVFTPVPPGP
jgi:hypothetical protein